MAEFCCGSRHQGSVLAVDVAKLQASLIPTMTSSAKDATVVGQGLLPHGQKCRLSAI